MSIDSLAFPDETSTHTQILSTSCSFTAPKKIEVAATATKSRNDSSASSYFEREESIDSSSTSVKGINFI